MRLITDSGTLPGRKARQLGIFLVVASNGAESLRDFLGRHVEHELAGALRVQYRAVLMFVVVIVVVIMIMAFVAVCFLGCSRWRSCLKSVSGAQRFCLPGATGP